MTPEQIEKERQAFQAWLESLLPCKELPDNVELPMMWEAWLARASLPAWVSVNDALPEPGTPVHAVFNGHVGIFVRVPDDEGSWLWARCYGCSSFDNWGEWIQDDDYQSITHWQPLPKPPCESKTP